jgi:16S rRNA (guanine527-N7)-methyltransferase
MATQREQFAAALTTLSPDFGVELGIAQVQLLTDYYALVLKWNELHLVAPCTPREFAVRHVLESLILLKHFSLNASVVDIGSGGGLPIIPCLLVRTDVRATLIESSRRKAVFLREALRLIEPPARARVINARFEEIDLPRADFLTCRALDRFSQLLPGLIRRTHPQTKLLLFAGDELKAQIVSRLSDTVVERLPQTEKRFLVIGSKTN